MTDPVAADREELLAEVRDYLGRQPGTRPGQGLSASTINSYLSQVRNLLRGIPPTTGSKPTHDSAMVRWRQFLAWRDRQRDGPMAPDPGDPGPVSRQGPVVMVESTALGASGNAEGGPPLLTFELRVAIATYATAERRLAALLGSRSIVGAIGELYVAVALGGRLAANSNAGYDVMSPRGARVQVKTCAATQGQFGGFTADSVERGLFDLGVFVRLDEDLLPTGALSFPIGMIPGIAKRRGDKHVAFWADLIRHPARTDLLAAVRDAALRMAPDQEPPDRDLLKP